VTADFVSFINTVVTDLQTNVTSLSTSNATVHKYALWDPAELETFPGRHFAVWPVAEQDSAEPLDSNSHLLTQRYSILVWESDTTEGERGVADETAAATFLQLHNDVRARFYVNANQQLGTSMRCWYVGAQFPEQAGRVRWFRIVIERLVPIGFS
jgi:hypothetical protein